MSSENTNVMLDTAELGDIVVAPEVIEIIIGIAATKVDGVYGMRGTLTSNVAERFGRQAYGKGIDLSIDEKERLIADIYTYLDYGVVVPKVALAMQEAVQQQVFSMTGLSLAEVNIHVVSIVPEKLKKTSTDNLFADDGVNS